MNYGAAFKAIFRSEGWFMQLVLLAVALLIPILGPIVAFGYGVEVEKTVLAGGAEAVLPRFDFGKFMEYVKLGAIPFVVGMVVGFASMPFTMGAYLLMVLPMALGAPTAVAVACLIAGALLMILFAVGLNLVALPMVLKSGLTGNFKDGFDFKFVLDFLRRVGGAMVLMMVALMAVGFVGGIVGVLMCFVGVYLVVAWIFVSQSHLLGQLAAMYVARGGTRLPPVTAPVVSTRAFPVVEG
ncbi:MAG TPA: DUF4013 domain-containing protein [Phycisphaerae bacterium]|nr:DUF4013 domain-containing protein [Phycisphaerae bacterium]